MADLNQTKAIKHLWKSGRKVTALPRKAVAKTQFPLRSAPVPHGIETAPSTIGVNYETEWARRPGARVARRVFLNIVWKPMIGFYAQPEIRNADRLKALGKSGAIFAANHHSHTDTAVMISVLVVWRKLNSYS